VVARNIDSNGRRSKGGAIRVGAVNALHRIFAPIADFALDAGLSVREIKSILQITSVKLLADHQTGAGQRRNISAIAARTGVSRNEISRILNKPAVMRHQAADHERQPINRVLSAWCSKSEFANSDERPADLKIYGDGASFDLLVKKYGGGVPTRALLDELVRVGSVELIATNTVRLKTEVAVSGALSANAIGEFGERSAEYLATLLSNIRSSEGRRLMWTYNGFVPSGRAVEALRRQISTRAFELHLLGNGCFSKKDARQNRQDARREMHAVSLMVVYCDEPKTVAHSTKTPTRRRNLRRKDL
jgi:uncharacterized protein DUF6502